MGRTGVASSAAIVARSFSRTIATVVIIIMAIDMMIANNPGTILVAVRPSRLNELCTTAPTGSAAQILLGIHLVNPA